MGNPHPVGRARPIQSTLVQVELELTLEGLTHGAIAWVPRTPRPYIGMPQQIAERCWWVTRIPDQAKRGTLSPENLDPPADEIVSEENRARQRVRHAARCRKGWETRKRAVTL